jgi:hypothetical protein
MQTSQHDYIQRFKLKVLVELGVGNYATLNGFVNGADGIFQGSNKILNSQEVLWISCNNPKCGQLTRIKMHICMNMKYILHGHL